MCTYVYIVSAVDCVVGPWIDGTCDAPCGGGTEIQTRDVITEAKYCGNLCGDLTQHISCNNHPCAGLFLKFICNARVAYL